VSHSWRGTLFDNRDTGIPEEIFGALDAFCVRQLRQIRHHESVNLVSVENAVRASKAAPARIFGIIIAGAIIDFLVLAVKFPENNACRLFALTNLCAKFSPLLVSSPKMCLVSLAASVVSTN
jgi:hypothetical protein